MPSPPPSSENKLQDILRSLTEILHADAGICYCEESPDYFAVAASIRMNKKALSGIKSIPRSHIEHLFSDSVQPIFDVDQTPLYAQFGSRKSQNRFGISDREYTRVSIVLLPMTHRSRLTAVFEITNPISDERIKSRKSLNALHVLAQSVFSSHLQMKNFEESQPFESGLEHGKATIIGRSKAITELKSMIARIAPTDSTVLLKGDTGTGKNIIAHSIHERSARRDMPFVKVNCAAIPENLLESELFGHEKGAFTGAFQRRIGRFERAHLGTIFLDEIGEISQNLQVKLLNVLQYQEFERLGGMQTIKVNTRIIAATNKNLEEAIANGEFREDLYYRLNVVPVTIPPLREHSEDIDLLARFFIQKIDQRLNVRFEAVSEEALFLLKKYHWPGNIRELENILERAMVIGSGPVIQPADLPQEIFGILDTVRKPKEEFAMREGVKSLWEVEKGIIERALQNLGWNQSKTARALGITRNHLRYRIKKYGIKKGEKSVSDS